MLFLSIDVNSSKLAIGAGVFFCMDLFYALVLTGRPEVKKL